MDAGKQMEEIQRILMGLVDTVGQIKGQIGALGDVNGKLDQIGDIAKAAKNSTDSAHKRLDEIKTQVEAAARSLEIAVEVRQEQRDLEKKVETIGKVADAAASSSATNKERMDKLDGRIWALILATAGVLIKMAFDLFGRSGSP